MRKRKKSEEGDLMYGGLLNMMAGVLLLFILIMCV